MLIELYKSEHNTGTFKQFYKYIKDNGYVVSYQTINDMANHVSAWGKEMNSKLKPMEDIYDLFVPILYRDDRSKEDELVKALLDYDDRFHPRGKKIQAGWSVKDN